MSDWTLHWLEAEGDLGVWREQIAHEIEVTRATVSHHLAPPRLDVLVQRLPGMVIQEIGLVGHAYRHSLFALQCDPDNESFAASLANGTLRRQVAHEVHHCLRIRGPGYGRTLGEALVSEGLAGHFVKLLFDNPPEPWECALSTDELDTCRPTPAALEATGYDHAAWFFGAGGQRPRWTGYTLGYAVVGQWLDATPDASVHDIVHVAAERVLAQWDTVSGVPQT